MSKMKDDVKFINKFKTGEEKIPTLPKQEEEKGTIGDMIKDMIKSQPVPNRIKYKIKRFNKVKVNGLEYEWGYGHYNYDGEYNWRLFIFDNQGKKIYNEEPVSLFDFNSGDIKEIINNL
jgi:hypothetical protein